MAEVVESKKKKRQEKAQITIINEFCKGCEICVIYCPKDVLKMERSKVVVVNLEACNKCMLCEIRCPDFAIKVK